MPRSALDTPFGPLTITERDDRIAALDWGHPTASETTPLLNTAARQIGEYASGHRQTFDLPLDTSHHPDFLKALLDIPFGETRTYGDLAKDLGLPAQAIGQLCGQNRIPILIPCHRVLAADTLGGYSGAGGIETKVALLKHEGAASLLI